MVLTIKFWNMNRIFPLLVCVILILVAACAPPPRNVLYEIDFSVEAYPDFISEVSGFSDREDWGRWMDADIAPSAKIRFKTALPKQFALVIKGQSMPGHEKGLVRVGDTENVFYIDGVGGTAKVYVELTQDADAIEILVPKAVTPRELGLNNDTRRLGLGLMKISIEEL